MRTIDHPFAIAGESSAIRDTDIVGSSAALQAVFSRLAKVAPTDSTVLITGETGTGKELIARAIHRGSPRSAHAFVSINCAATPASLIASELFGHERGAFTGALQRRTGRFEVAAGGTLFLDEVGELPLETQIALLRVLQEREFERVGGTTAIRADVRVVAATNRDLDAAITAGTFRSDLYYRLNVFPVEIPPLRERKEDIRALVDVFVERYARRAKKTIRGISTKTLELLEAHAWPGNVRELQNVIERSVIMSDCDMFSIDEGWLSHAAAPAQPPSGSTSAPPAPSACNCWKTARRPLHHAHRAMVVPPRRKRTAAKRIGAQFIGADIERKRASFAWPAQTHPTKSSPVTPHDASQREGARLTSAQRIWWPYSRHLMPEVGDGHGRDDGTSRADDRNARADAGKPSLAGDPDRPVAADMAAGLGRHGVPRMQPHRQPVGAMTAASSCRAGDVAETARVTLQGSPAHPAS